MNYITTLFYLLYIAIPLGLYNILLLYYYIVVRKNINELFDFCIHALKVAAMPSHSARILTLSATG